MRKRIVFPCTSRVHWARQKSLVRELRKRFVVDVFEPEQKYKNDLEAYTLLSAIQFKNFLDKKKRYDFGLVRADRMELLPIASLLAYRQVPIVHIEGGAESGARVIDTRVRDAITQLADIHLVTDAAARRKVSQLVGTSDRVYDVGSLDVSFAMDVASKNPRSPVKGDYVLFLHHAIPGEDTETVYAAVKAAGIPVVGVKSNSDYRSSLMREEYSPEAFVALMNGAKCMVGNSSAICKELSVLGTPGVLTGSRQDGRTVGRNVVRVRHDAEEIRRAVEWQASRGRYAPDTAYYRPDTERRIVDILSGI